MDDYDDRSPQRHPLDWPPGFPRTPGRARKRGKFGKITVIKACEAVFTQLRLMGINHQDIVISSNVKTRLDGLPYSNMKPTSEDPGVAVYWRDSDGDPLSMACDSYSSVEANIRALSLTLEAFRAIERHGSSDLMKRAFRGFKALPAAIPMSAPWYATLEFDEAPDAFELVEARYRELMKSHHPDRPGGNGAKATELNLALDAAQRFFGAR